MSPFTEISLVLGIATLVAALMRFLKQPLIIAYIATGIIAGPYVLNLTNGKGVMSLFSEVGVALLLFIIGLSLNPRVLKEVGAISIISGIGQVIFTSLIGYFIVYKLFHFSFISSLYIAVGLTFSSTIIILKLLTDKGDLQTLYGKISIGFLLTQDLIAMAILVALSSLGFGKGADIPILFILAKVFSFLFLLVVVSIYILPRLGRFFASSQESLFLFSVAWGLGLASLAINFGFTREIGALAAGVALSVSPYTYEIGAKMKILRDFFLILFFIMLGSQMMIEEFSGVIFQAIALSLFVLIGNPFIMMIIMGLLGYSRRVSFLTGLTVAQISEFSLILVIVGINLGHLAPSILSLMTLVGFITITGSTYLILYSEWFYKHLAPYLSIFERKQPKKKKEDRVSYEAVLFGYNRIGYDFKAAFDKLKKKCLVVDFDPHIIEAMRKNGVECRYGDASDPEFLEELSMSCIKMVVSTIPDIETNLLLIKTFQRSRAVIIVMAYTISEAEALYKEGANYVVMPHFLGGHYASSMLEEFGFHARKFSQERRKHLRYLAKRKAIGHLVGESI